MSIKKAKKASRAVVGENSASPATEAGAVPAKAGGKRILLVDDDHEIVESMRTVLESRGYQILVARDGNQGLVLAEGEEPDLETPAVRLQRAHRVALVKSSSPYKPSPRFPRRSPSVWIRRPPKLGMRRGH